MTPKIDLTDIFGPIRKPAETPPVVPAVSPEARRWRKTFRQSRDHFAGPQHSAHRGREGRVHEHGQRIPRRQSSQYALRPLRSLTAETLETPGATLQPIGWGERHSLAAPALVHFGRCAACQLHPSGRPRRRARLGSYAGTCSSATLSGNLALRASRGDAVVLLATFGITLFRGLTEAIVVGFALGSVLFIHRMSQTTALETDVPLAAGDVPDDKAREAGDETSGQDPTVVIYRISSIAYRRRQRSKRMSAGSERTFLTTKQGRPATKRPGRIPPSSSTGFPARFSSAPPRPSVSCWSVSATRIAISSSISPPCRSSARRPPRPSKGSRIKPRSAASGSRSRGCRREYGGNSPRKAPAGRWSGRLSRSIRLWLKSAATGKREKRRSLRDDARVTGKGRQRMVSC